ncbi:hypothetical protein AB0D10_40860 [Kitasatospora sp. NPDC048545]|uniref:hypothetical protein n=1 Tax=Kitasatospora sp. NPDC048545 TaxID=3157208 RepID=UPI003401ABAD
MAIARDEERVRHMVQTLDRHQAELLGRRGCTGVAVARKEVGGRTTDTLSITVYVRNKRADLSVEELIPPMIGGFPTDVVEEDERRFELLGTDPFAQHDPLFGGIAIAAWELPKDYGSLGCFIRTTGRPNEGIDAGDYLLTCRHVLVGAVHNDHRVIQPNYDGNEPPEKYFCGNYVAGYQNAANDCALVRVVWRSFENKVPNYPWWPGFRSIKGVGMAVPGDAVYKYGATTKFTKGVVDCIDYTSPEGTRTHVILIRGTDDVWIAEGDSGSVAIRQDDDFVVALNFGGDPDHIISPVSPVTYSYGYSYDIQGQMDNFAATGGRVGLAP